MQRELKYSYQADWAKYGNTDLYAKLARDGTAAVDAIGLPIVGEMKSVASNRWPAGTPDDIGLPVTIVTPQSGRITYSDAGGMPLTFSAELEDASGKLI